MGKNIKTWIPWEREIIFLQNVLTCASYGTLWEAIVLEQNCYLEIFADVRMNFKVLQKSFFCNNVVKKGLMTSNFTWYIFY